MTMLAFDTSMAACSAAVWRDGVVARRFQAMSRGHAEALFPMIREVMTEAGVSFADLHAIAVTRGPGSFTGVRVGVAAARGLALAADKPVIAATSLEVIAHGAASRLTPEQAREPFVVAMDARRGELYCQQFAGGRAVSDAQALSPEDCARTMPHEDCVAVGSGAPFLAQAAGPDRRVIALQPDILPDAADLAAICADRAPETSPLSPLYLRAPDAKPQDGFAVARLGR
ncbi:tRNA (adenosine(37)-N6)-threonylcarbamoyltransferase complex dimerization subunit type 1 TsaB [Dichotomicrobium thermohalophilum]|uniref:tRNA threonylcarbamoyladenosine biosynthesis protein TsaB n=1 Tax=Dichotomicrobium thermohalophilum TaxID=933063 RepID=A0A397Q357_9HYPH|nr:tRNA (adenosine(37)-N6)-threonylcarbamoyltransferase complex dimerization subunit type 1 TsaB [Dichotomicrobium thermohalophilum]RIA55363.1 tRNA threonylcarbamoyladenosine biosynthesis protein TsaB [Dichotomicrobium thermohalophilum]